MCRQTSKQFSSLIWICAVLFVYTYFKFVQNLRIIRVAECYNDNLFFINLQEDVSCVSFGIEFKVKSRSTQATQIKPP